MTDTITINNQEYSVYAGMDAANTYMAAALHADSWRAATDDTRMRSLVTATRVLDRQTWPGAVSSDVQALAWPRINTNIDGVEDTVIPDDIASASIEIALALIDGNDLQNQTTVERVRSLTAGSVSITNFRGIDKATRFPQIVQELLSKYLVGDLTGLFVSKATDVAGETIFPIDLSFTSGV